MNIDNTLSVEIKIPGFCVEEYMNDKFQSSLDKVIEDIENMQYKIDINCEDMKLKTGENTLNIIKVIKYALYNAKITINR